MNLIETSLGLIISETELHGDQFERIKTVEQNCYKKFNLKVIKTNSSKLKSLSRWTYTSWGIN